MLPKPPTPGSGSPTQSHTPHQGGGGGKGSEDPLGRGSEHWGPFGAELGRPGVFLPLPAQQSQGLAAKGEG